MRPRNPKNRKSAEPAKPVLQQAWFVQMLPSPINGEVRLRMKRPSAWISVAETKKLMACSVQKIHSLCEDGTLEWRWVHYEGAGGKKLVLVDSVHRYITRKSQFETS